MLATMRCPVHLFAALAFCLSLVGCKKVDMKVLRLQQEIEALEEVVKAESLASKALLEQARREREVLDRIRATMGQMNIEADQMRAEQEAVEQAFMQYHMAYQRAAWAKAPSMKLGDVVAAGRTYRDVTLRSVSWKEFAIQHQDGTTKIATDDLPENLRKLFGLDLPKPLADQSLPLTADAAGNESALDTPDIILPTLEGLPSTGPRKPSSGAPSRPTSKKPGLQGGFQNYKPVGKNYKAMWNNYREIGGK